MLVRTILQEKGSWVATIEQGASIAAATQALAEHGVGALVVSSDGHSIEGIISERDIVRGLARDPDVGGRKVSDLMTREVMTCAPDATIDSLMAVMTEKRVRHLPIVENDAILGIISIGDVVKHRLQELQTEAQTLHDYIATGR
jgi:CBS domain-containing protein